MAITLDVQKAGAIRLGMVPGRAPWLRLTIRQRDGGDAHSIDIETDAHPADRLARATEAFMAVLAGANMLPVYPEGAPPIPLNATEILDATREPAEARA